MNINVSQYFTHRAQIFPHIEAAVDANTRYTYRKLNQQVNQLVHWLKEKNIRKGDRIALLCQNSVPMLTILLATLKCGAIALPLNCKLNVRELKAILHDAEPTVLFYDAIFQETVQQLKSTNSLQYFVQVQSSETTDTTLEKILQTQPVTEPEIIAGGDDQCLLIYTSGTTGNPKGVKISHKNIWVAAYNIGNHFEWRSFDRNLVMTPLFHISGWMFTFANFLRGSTVIYADFHPAYIWDIIEQERITQTFAVPAMIKLMINDPSWLEKEVETLRYIVCGADTVPAQLIQKCNSFGIEICHGYGCTESSGTVASWTIGMDPEKKHTAGRPFPLTELKIVDPITKTELPRGSVGEVVFRGPQVFQGYWNNPNETGQVLRKGWYYSGDLGKMDQDGYLILVDRYKDMIISAGENIYPAEVEKILLNLDGIQEVAVVGAPDEIKGQIPMAFIVKQPDSSLTKQDILQFCHGQLAAFKCGQHVEFVDELPRNSNGKVLKSKLREWAKTIIEKQRK